MDIAANENDGRGEAGAGGVVVKVGPKIRYGGALIKEDAEVDDGVDSGDDH